MMYDHMNGNPQNEFWYFLGVCLCLVCRMHIVLKGKKISESVIMVYLL